MRRVLQGAAIAALASMSLLGLAVPADAASGSLVVNAIDRAGRSTSTWAYVMNTKTGDQYTLTTGKSRRLPPGQYGAMVVIAPDGYTWGATQTLGSAVVNIGRRQAVVGFDARKGKRLTVTPSISNPAFFTYEANICFGGHYNYGMASYDGMADYVIPTSDKRVQFGLDAFWARSTDGPFYAAAIKATRGIPGKPLFSYARTSYAKLQLKVLKGHAKKSSTVLMLGPAGPAFPCASGTVGWGDFAAPRTVTAYVASGDWDAYINYDSGVTPLPTQHFVGGRTYHFTLDRPA